MPQPTAVIQVEGVLRKPVTGAVMDSGRRLYLGLASFYRIVLVTDETNQQGMHTWLAVNSFARHDHIVFPMTWAADIRVPQWLNTARTLKLSYGYDVDVIVIPDPANARVLIEHGYSTLLFTDAAYSLPEWRPDSKPGIQPWGELEEEIRYGLALRAKDQRMEDKLQ